MHHLHI